MRPACVIYALSKNDDRFGDGAASFLFANNSFANGLFFDLLFLREQEDLEWALKVLFGVTAISSMLLFLVFFLQFSLFKFP